MSTGEHCLSLIRLDLSPNNRIFFIDIDCDGPITKNNRPILFLNSRNRTKALEQSDLDEAIKNNPKLELNYCIFDAAQVIRELREENRASDDETVNLLNYLIDILYRIPETDRKCIPIKILLHGSRYFTFNRSYDLLFGCPTVKSPSPRSHKHKIPVNYFPEGTDLSQQDLIDSICWALGMIQIYSFKI